MSPEACPVGYTGGLTAEQLRENMRWVNALAFPPEAVRVALALAALCGYACEGRGPQRYYRGQIAACVAWPDLPRQHRIALARISRWTTWLRERGYIRKVLDLSECERDDAGNIISHAGAFCWYELVRAPEPGEEPPEPAPREKGERPEPPGRPCPNGHKRTRKLYTTYQCSECGLVFTDKGADAIEARNAARTERIRRSGLSVVPRPRPPSMAEMLASPVPATVPATVPPVPAPSWKATMPPERENHVPPTGARGQGRDAGAPRRRSGPEGSLEPCATLGGWFSEEAGAKAPGRLGAATCRRPEGHLWRTYSDKDGVYCDWCDVRQAPTGQPPALHLLPVGRGPAP